MRVQASARWEIKWARLNHLVRLNHGALVFMTDHELGGDAWAGRSAKEYIEFCEGAGILIHDAIKALCNSLAAKANSSILVFTYFMTQDTSYGKYF
jgi:hypothetical protein